MRWSGLTALALALVSCGCRRADEPAESRPPAPVTGVFLSDPAGKVETIAAGGHLVAWTERTPADRLDVNQTFYPLTWPVSTKVVVADERGGRRLRVDLGPRWVEGLWMLHDARGELQLAVRSCASRRRSSCRDELWTLSASAPVSLTARVSGAEAAAGYAGTLDRGRRLLAVSRTPCPGRLAVQDASGSRRTLPALPAHDREYPHCEGLVRRLITGHYAFAWVGRAHPGHHFYRDLVYGIDLDGGTDSRWHFVESDAYSNDYSGGIGVGPAVTDHALYWEETETEEETIDSLDRVALPPTSKDPSTAAPISTGYDLCAIAATGAAIYQLTNPRCAFFPYGRGGAVVRRRRLAG